MYDEITTHGRFAFVLTKRISSKDGLKKKNTIVFCFCQIVIPEKISIL